MKCARCDETGAARMEIRFRNGARVVLYLCRECAEGQRRHDDVTELVRSPGA